MTRRSIIVHGTKEPDWHAIDTFIKTFECCQSINHGFIGLELNWSRKPRAKTMEKIRAALPTSCQVIFTFHDTVTQ